jgi:pyridoxamine 5'-phosphate oxidase
MAVQSDNPEPTGVNLSTVYQGRPKSRKVLLKGLENGQLIFFTNYRSDKSTQLEQNPHAALTFYWPELEKQVRIEGRAEKISSERSDAYYHSRPRDSRIGAWVSHQSSVIATREILEKQFEAMNLQFQNKDIPRPDYWGGYGVTPDYMEFWQGRPNRLHDRLAFSRLPNNTWKAERLAP